MTNLHDVVTGDGLKISLKVENASSASSGLISMLDACKSLVSMMNTQINNGELRKSPYLVGSISSEQFETFDTLIASIKRRFPRVLGQVFRTPLEIDAINASFWSGTEIQGRNRGDALINMVFSERCSDLPLHCHPFSDRVIFVIRGSGYGYFCPFEIQDYNPATIGRVQVRQGDILCYPCSTLHTFSTMDEPIELLTYHSKFVPFDDERQYDVLSDVWTPKETASVHTFPRAAK